MKACFLFITLLIFATLAFTSNLYKWEDENGNIHYADEPPSQNPKQVKKVELQPLNSFKNTLPEHTEKNISSQPETVDKQLVKSDPVIEEVKLSSTDCFGPSPLTNDTPLNRKKLTKDQHSSLSSLLSNMKGSWHGKATYFECKGKVDDPEIEKKQYTVSADIRLKRFKELTIKFEMYAAKDRITTHENIELFLSDEYLTFSHYLSDETVLLKDSSDHIELWVENFPTNGVRNELVRIFEIKNRIFSIKQYQYVNGALAGIMHWYLVK